MIEPTEDDIGRAVLYQPYPMAEKERGVIKSLSAAFPGESVFVRYGHQDRGLLTPLHMLEWETP